MTVPGNAAVVEVILNQSFASRREVIEAIGAAMLAASAITPDYIDGMLRKEEQGGTVVTAEVALPHGTNDVKHAVRSNVLVIVPIPNGVEWTPGTQVRLAIGFAGTGDQDHLRLLAAVARVLSDQELLNRVKVATTPQHVADIVKALSI